MWRPRGERGLSSCRSRFITLVLVSPRRSGLRSRGAGSPMTNVPVSRQQAPPGPATPSAQQAPGECLRCQFRARSSGERQVSKKVAVVPVPPRVNAPWTWGRGELQTRVLTNPKRLSEVGRGTGKARLSHS